MPIAGPIVKLRPSEASASRLLRRQIPDADYPRGLYVDDLMKKKLYLKCMGVDMPGAVAESSPTQYADSNSRDRKRAPLPYRHRHLYSTRPARIA